MLKSYDNSYQVILPSIYSMKNVHFKIIEQKVNRSLECCTFIKETEEL